MNMFFYNLGKSTANVIDASVNSTSKALSATSDAASSFVQGLQEQTAANRAPSVRGYTVSELQVA